SGLSRSWAVTVTSIVSARGASGSSRETMMTGRNFAAKPRSAIQTSDIEEALVGQLDDLGHPAPNLFGGFRAPFPELSVRLLSEGVHESSSPGRMIESRQSLDDRGHQAFSSLTIDCSSPGPPRRRQKRRRNAPAGRSAELGCSVDRTPFVPTVAAGAR